MYISQYKNETDEKIVELIREGHPELTDIIFERYKEDVKKKSIGLTLIGGDIEDLLQEGMIGLFHAIRDYRKDRDCSFATFASICIRSSMVNAVLHYQSKKYGPLNSSLSINNSPGEGGNNIFETYYGDPSSVNPEKITLDMEAVQELMEKIEACLSKKELMVFEYSQQGLDTKEIAETMNTTVKSVANTMTRIKQKVKKLIQQ